MKQITEVGVAVKDLEKATRLFVELLGAKAGEVITVERYQMRYRMCRLGNVDFELMEPLGEEGVIARFIETHGEGLHHVGFAVENLLDHLAALKEEGVPLIDEEPQELLGATYAFVHPSAFSGVMFELIQYPEGIDLPR
ncbi:MAG: VOC family protein [Deltaproteobacteria bacterium]